MPYLGKDTELREALKQQQAAIDAAKAQAEQNAEGQLHKSEAFMIVLAIMAVLVIFRK